jgi:alkylation response protein AidB-like acyl-CoA dehydrogenase
VNFDLSEEQELLQETIRQLLDNECPPTRLREIFESESGHDPALWKSLVGMGLPGLAVPEEYGGAGLEMIDLALATETLAYGGAPGPFFGHSLATLALVLGGSAQQKEHWLPRLAAGDVLGTIALGEGGGVWDPDAWTVTLTESGGETESYEPYTHGAPPGATLSGTKTWVPYASLADLFVVGVAGGGLALVARGDTGLHVEPVEGADRARRLDTVTFDAAACEPLAEGVAAAPRLRDAGLVLLAADAFGTASRLLDMCVEYAKTREQFGVTIGHFQALKHQLANMAVEVEPARGLFWYAAHAFDHIQKESARSAALAKAHISDVAMQVARDAVEAHGGIGFTWECDVQMWFKRAMLDRAWLGTPDVHRERAAQLAGW